MLGQLAPWNLFGQGVAAAQCKAQDAALPPPLPPVLPAGQARGDAAVPLISYKQTLAGRTE